MIYRCPRCNAPFQSDAAGVVICPACGAQVRTGVAAAPGNAWDRAQRGGWSGAFFETVKRSIADPVSFFEEVAAGSGWVRPWAYATGITTVVFLVAMAYQAGFQALAISASLAAELKSAFFPFAALSIPVTLGLVALLTLVVVPLFTTLTLFFQAAICHGCLMALSAVRRDYWATFRTVCYASGPQLFQVVPILGGLVGPLWQLVLVIIGLKVVHQTSYGRSALAVFLPTILCCGALLLVGVAVIGGVAGALIGTAH